jgi:hypothetical protein
VRIGELDMAVVKKAVTSHQRDHAVPTSIRLAVYVR